MAGLAKAIRHCHLYRADRHDQHQQPGKELFTERIHRKNYSQIRQDYNLKAWLQSELMALAIDYTLDLKNPGLTRVGPGGHFLNRSEINYLRQGSF